MDKKLKWVLIIVVVGVAAYYGYKYYKKNKPASKETVAMGNKISSNVSEIKRLSGLNVDDLSEDQWKKNQATIDGLIKENETLLAQLKSKI